MRKKRTKKEIEQELVNLAKLRWEIIKDDPDYKKAFDNFVLDLKSKDTKGDHREWSKNPLYFKNYPMLPNESINDFERRGDYEILGGPYLPETFFDLYSKAPLEKWKGIKKTFAELEIIPYEYTISYPAIEIKKRWGICPPVDPGVKNLNPWSLKSLAYTPIKELGNSVFELPPRFDADYVCSDNIEFKKFKENRDQLTCSCGYVVSNVYWHEKDKGHFCSDTKKIILEIDLDHPIKYIKHRFDEIVAWERKKLIRNGSVEDKKNNLEVIASAIKVYRLKRGKKKWEDIAKEIFPNDFKDPFKLKETDPDQNPDSAIAKVKQYHKKAEELIREGV